MLLGGAAASRADPEPADRRRRLRQADEPVGALLQRRAVGDGRPRCPSRSTSQHPRRTASTPGATPCGSSRPTKSGRCTAASSRRSIRASARASPSACRPPRRSPRPRPTPRGKCTAAAREHIRAQIRPAPSWRCRARPASRRGSTRRADRAWIAYRTRVMRLDLHRRPRRPAAGVDPGRHRVAGCPVGAVVHRLGRRRRGAARSRRHRCRVIAGSSVPAAERFLAGRRSAGAAR